MRQQSDRRGTTTDAWNPLMAPRDIAAGAAALLVSATSLAHAALWRYFRDPPAATMSEDLGFPRERRLQPRASGGAGRPRRPRRSRRGCRAPGGRRDRGGSRPVAGGVGRSLPRRVSVGPYAFVKRGFGLFVVALAALASAFFASSLHRLSRVEPSLATTAGVGFGAASASLTRASSS